MDRLKNFDWEAVAGIAAALVALILHLVGVAAEGVLLSVALVILALILLRSLRKEANEERSLQLAERMDAKLAQMRSLLSPSDTVLIGPQSLLQESERFAASAQGEMTWFNVCLLMFVRQALFDVLLKPQLRIRTLGLSNSSSMRANENVGGPLYCQRSRFAQVRKRFASQLGQTSTNPCRSFLLT